MNHSHQFGPEFTPYSIKVLILVTSITTILSGLFNNLFINVFNILGPQEILSLSWHGISNLFLWQPLTHFFFFSSYSSGLSFGLLLTLLFNMLILWIFGTQIIATVKTKPFLRFYLGSGIFSGLVGLVVMQLTGQYSILSGCSPIISSLLFIWNMLNPNATLFLFFVIPVTAKWLIGGLIGANLLINLSQGDLVTATIYLSSFIFAYLYASLSWELKSPYLTWEPVDNWFINIGRSWRYHFLSQKNARQQFTSHSKSEVNHTSSPKIFNINTGQSQTDDDEFVDSMLAKISENGKESLSNSEVKRLDSISQKKRP